MKAHPKEVKDKVLELLQNNRGPKEISQRMGISIGAIEDWSSDWRKSGQLKAYKRPGQEFTNLAKSLSNGFYSVIRIKYLSMRWTDKCSNREFGFNNQTEVIKYFLDADKNPRKCAYCGAAPPKGKVWGLDRLDSVLGHQPRNLVPCCGTNDESNKLSCQASKSKFDLRQWMKSNISRSLGREATEDEVNTRLEEIKRISEDIENCS